MAPPATFSNDQYMMTRYSPSLRTVLRRLDNLIDWERQRRARGTQRLMRVDSKPCLRLLASLGNPQDALSSVVHVTGSKGKGTVSTLITAGLRRAHPDAHVLTYGSPHVERVNERIRIDGAPIADDALATALSDALDARDAEPDATWFDVMTATGLLAGQRLDASVAVVEVGMGGRLDSTNVFGGAPVALITNIRLEHADIIGPTLTDIATEKAGVIGTGTTTALVGMDESDALADAFRAQVASVAPATPGLRFMPPRRGDSLFDINLRMARAAVAAVVPGAEIPDDVARDALRALPARQEAFRIRGVPITLDGAHVPGSVHTVLAEAAATHPSNLAVVVAVGKDKDMDGIAQAVLDNPRVDKIFVTTTGIEFIYLPADKLKAAVDRLISEQRGNAPVACDVEDDAQLAVQKAIDYAAREDQESLQVVVIGSLHLAGRVRPLLVQLDESKRAQ